MATRNNGDLKSLRELLKLNDGIRDARISSQNYPESPVASEGTKYRYGQTGTGFKQGKQNISMNIP